MKDRAGSRPTQGQVQDFLKASGGNGAAANAAKSRIDAAKTTSGSAVSEFLNNKGSGAAAARLVRQRMLLMLVQTQSQIEPMLVLMCGEAGERIGTLRQITDKIGCLDGETDSLFVLKTGVMYVQIWLLGVLIAGQHGNKI